MAHDASSPQSGTRRPRIEDQTVRRTWGTLAAAAFIIVLTAAIPLILRLSMRPTPEINSTARDLLPPAFAKTDLVTLYSNPGAWADATRDSLPRYDEAVRRVFPPTRPGVPGGFVENMTPIEGIIVDDPETFGQLWVQIFGGDTRRFRERGVGRASFFLVLADSDGESIETPSSRDIADIAHVFGQSVLEQALNERYRYLPDWYRAIVGELVAVAVVSEALDDARDEYAEWRQTNEPMTEREYLTGPFRLGESTAIHDAMTTLIAARLLESDRLTEFISLVDEGEELETAFRAAAATAAQRDSVDRPVPIGSSLGAALEAIEADYQRDRVRDASDDG
ncbi:MAG: hypothetical protein ACF8PN_01675 [Phycisphaerales bacterium]